MEKLLKNVILSCVDYQQQGHREQGRAPVKEYFTTPLPLPPNKGRTR